MRAIYAKYAELRDTKQMSDYRVAKETKIAKSIFSEWKSGRSTPKTDKLKTLADYFGVSIEYFLEDDAS